MSIENVIRRKAREAGAAGLSDEFLIAVMCRYLNQQRNDAGFEAFLDRAIAEEQVHGERYSITPGRAPDMEFDDDGWIVVKHTDDMYDHVAFVQTETMARLYVHASGHRLPDEPEERGAHRGAALPTEQRALNAEAALPAYLRQRNRSHLTAEDELEDLVADILHLCDRRRISPARVLRRALRDYERERGETIITAILTPE